MYVLYANYLVIGKLGMFLQGNVVVRTPDFKRRVGKTIQERRDELGYKQEAIEQDTPIKRSTLANYERGEILPSLANAVVLADWLKITLDELVGRGRQHHYPSVSHERLAAELETIPADITLAFMTIVEYIHRCQVVEKRVEKVKAQSEDLVYP